MSEANALSQFIFSQQLWGLNNYASLAALVVWTLDFCDTLPQEISSVWSRQFSLTSALFVVNRYSSLCYQVVQLTFNLPGHTTNEACARIFIASQTFNILASAITSVLFALRVFAIYSRRTTLLVLLLAPVLASAFFIIYYSTLVRVVSTDGTLFSILSRCGIITANVDPSSIDLYLWTVTYQDAHRGVVLVRLIGGSVLPIIFDTMVFVLTLRKTVSHAMEAHQLGRASITQVLLRDGTFYYFAFLMVGLGEVLLNVLIPQFAGSPLGCSIATGFTVAPTILVNRMVLNLRCFWHHRNDTKHGRLPHPSLPIDLPRATSHTLTQDGWLGDLDGNMRIDSSSWNNDEDGDIDENEDEEVGAGRGAQTTLVPVVYTANNIEAVSMVPLQKSVKRGGHGTENSGPYVDLGSIKKKNKQRDPNTRTGTGTRRDESKPRQTKNNEKRTATKNGP
ncbi:uncharacterized protein STEHIDRAFT_113199 [Stereum hirsutum FP-91666 SS1]|uniref:uncharacterized protein n=1 Tax=Stereum hirsutum (strain FP-91666) TaxID=721885 RepID=UPI000444A047|nr:uncharacterized protein STEHIDRAFT_113199 [Stereum hirsutum FP-91666 SS1]EIM83977.1 hypothetical protein STEHIDRAFT_113199 [Stereum hirsutum FP-91666 SS1]